MSTALDRRIVSSQRKTSRPRMTLFFWKVSEKTYFSVLLTGVIVGLAGIQVSAYLSKLSPPLLANWYTVALSVSFGLVFAVCLTHLIRDFAVLFVFGAIVAFLSIAGIALIV